MTCRFWKGHDWTVWEVVQEGHITNKEKIVGLTMFQKRQCKICGFTELDTQNKTIYE